MNGSITYRNLGNGISFIQTITAAGHHGWVSPSSGQDIYTVNIKQYTPNYKNLSSADFICCFLSVKAWKNNIANSASQTATVSLSHYYEPSTGVLTVYQNYSNGENTWTDANIIYVYGVI